MLIMENLLNCSTTLLTDEGSDVFFDATDIPVISEEDVVETKSVELSSYSTEDRTQTINSQDSFPKQKTEEKTTRPFRNRRKGSGPSTGLRAVTHTVSSGLILPCLTVILKIINRCSTG